MAWQLYLACKEYSQLEGRQYRTPRDCLAELSKQRPDSRFRIGVMRPCTLSDGSKGERLDSDLAELVLDTEDGRCSHTDRWDDRAFNMNIKSLIIYERYELLTRCREAGRLRVLSKA